MVDGKPLSERLRGEVKRALRRRLKGLDYLSSPGPVVGRTPKTLLHRRGTLSLYHYHPSADEIYRVPVLLVMAPINKADLFDLTKGQSLVEFLLHRGYDVYVVDWNAPSADEKHLKLDNYVLDFIPDCLRRVQEDCGEAEVTLIGYCMAGVLSTLYAALHPDGPLKNLVCFTTPIDWQHVPWHRVVAHPKHFDVDRLVDRLGIIPAEMIVKGFDMLRPAGRLAGQLRLWDNMWNDDYVKGYRMMIEWGASAVPLAGECYRQIVKELMWKNGLMEGTLRIGGRAVVLEQIRVPLLHVIAEYDTLVPPASAKPLLEKVASQDKQEIVLPGGHVSLVAGPAAVRRMWPALDQWLGRRSL
ncbi:alpha/beta fold hydrolase [Pseudomonas sp. UL073]|uniref:Alpha/beta fold hydrolase n=1 Tax=Zestomonas insulae TaxID=2809017 RepID=A0ABS2IHI7_9GAMM|nr:alpha/beta fold hydrolase [Pseudomonas insulae]MBM7062529.1 alpha/beta fold hydrolase [Pseudomonas insulae]